MKGIIGLASYVVLLIPLIWILVWQLRDYRGNEVRLVRLAVIFMAFGWIWDKLWWFTAKTWQELGYDHLLWMREPEWADSALGEL